MNKVARITRLSPLGLIGVGVWVITDKSYRQAVGLDSLFSYRVNTAVIQDPLDPFAVSAQESDRIYGLKHTSNLIPLLSSRTTLWHSPIRDRSLSYPFLIVEAKPERKGPGFSVIEEQTAFPIRTLLKIQEDLQNASNDPTGHCGPLVWFLANRGDEWRVYGSITDGPRYVRLSHRGCCTV